MKTLKTLIKLQKDAVDKLKKELSQIEERRQKAQDEYDDLGRQLELEAEAANNFPEAFSAYAAFAKRTMDRQKNLKKTITILEQAIEKKRDELQIEFSEQKKYEIALEARELALFEENKRREALKMDEVALRGFSRKES